MRVIVFTCVIGKTDALKRPNAINKGVRYVCFSDRSQVVAPYELVRVPTGVDPRLTSRQIKIAADHPVLAEADATFWHDAAFRLECDPVRLATDLLSDSNMVALKHPHRTQIEDEALAIDQWGYVPMATMQAQIAAYRADGFQQSHITSTGLCIRRTTPALAAFNAFWWQQVQQWGWRDQMSVDYAMWKTGVTATYMPGHYRNNKYATWFLNTSNRLPVRRSAQPSMRTKLPVRVAR